MDGRGGCCIARYDVGGGGAYDDVKKMERVMLKFRPIAPKPVTTGSGSVFGSSSSSDNSNNKTSSGETTTYVKASRAKRKYNTMNTSTTTNKRRYNGVRKRVTLSTSHSLDEKNDGSSVVTATTLTLLPESPSTAAIKTPTSRSTPMWLSFSNNSINSHNNYFSNSQRVVESVVTVERVEDTWASGEGLGRTDEERVMNLEYDTCPGFITKGYENGVRWTNRAYKRMVCGDDNGDEVVVRVVMKEDEKLLKLISGGCGGGGTGGGEGFTCRVKVESTCKKEIRVLLCDVWRMDGGGFAWRLDVKSALSLGR